MKRKQISCVGVFSTLVLVAAGLFLVSLLSSSVRPSGGSVTHTVGFFVEGYSDDYRSIPSFDTSLGTLTGVTVETHLGLKRETFIEMVSPFGRILEITSWDYLTYHRWPNEDELGQDGDAWWSLKCIVPNVPNLENPFIKAREKTTMVGISGAFDGIIDYHGPSGETWTIKTPSKSDSKYYDDPAVLAHFINAGGLAQLRTITNHHYAQWVFVYNNALWGGGHYVHNRGKLMVTYHYQ